MGNHIKDNSFIFLISDKLELIFRKIRLLLLPPHSMYLLKIRSQTFRTKMNVDLCYYYIIVLFLRYGFLFGAASEVVIFQRAPCNFCYRFVRAGLRLITDYIVATSKQTNKYVNGVRVTIVRVRPRGNLLFFHSLPVIIQIPRDI